MKKICLLLVLTILFAFSGCSLTGMSPEKITTDAVKMYYDSADISVVIEDDALTKEVTAMYNDLKLTKTKDNIDNSSIINVVFYENKKEKAVLSVDKNEVLYLYRNKDDLYKVTNKEFDYKRLEQIYNDHKK